MDERTIKKLYEVFQLSTRQGTGGMTFKYVPNEAVINRMNEVFQGNWSTKVTYRDTIDDQVILEVEVSVVDPETQMTFSHTGFGSQQIMRYNSGPNQGKIIDIGNGFKGALAKAIVNSCTRWGVGLYKESNPMDDDAATQISGSPEDVPVSVAVPPSSLPGAQPIMPQIHEAPAAPPVAAAPPAAPVAPAVPAAPAAPAVPAAPPVAPAAPAIPNVPVPPTGNESPVVAEKETTFPPPISPEQPVSATLEVTQTAVEMPKIPAPDAGQSTQSAPMPGLNEVHISDVQKVALNGILTMNNADYNELAAEAFQANGINKPVPPRENLNYDEAVTVIKYGNEKYRKNR